MITNEASVRIAHAMLSVLANHKKPTFRMFYADYRALFSPVRVPAVREFPLGDTIGFVDIDCAQGIAYLKDKYNFVDSNELQQILTEEAKHMQELENG